MGSDDDGDVKSNRGSPLPHQFFRLSHGPLVLRSDSRIFNIKVAARIHPPLLPLRPFSLPVITILSFLQSTRTVFSGGPSEQHSFNLLSPFIIFYPAIPLLLSFRKFIITEGRSQPYRKSFLFFIQNISAWTYKDNLCRTLTVAKVIYTVRLTLSSAAFNPQKGFKATRL